MQTDHLGSVALTSKGWTKQGNIRLYYPFGEERAGTDPTATERGFTGHQENDYIKLIYMGARFYLPSAGRFLSPDTIVPDPTNPQAYNRYSYVYNRPINLVDPSGHNPVCNQNGSICSDGAYDDAQGQPFWWTTEDIQRVYVEGYGLFDKLHLDRGFRSADWLFGEIREAIANGGDTIVPGSEFADNTWFVKDYYVPGNIAQDDILGIAWAIYMDFEIAYEGYQLRGKTSWTGLFGGFSPEDLPSDYIGFWAYTQGYSVNDIPHIIEGLGSVSSYSSPAGPVVFNVLGSNISLAKNYQFLPMPLTVSNKYSPSIVAIWQNSSWPEYLQVNPINSSPNSWQAGEQRKEIR